MGANFRLLSRPSRFDPSPFVFLNFKAEIEIRLLHEKIDTMMLRQGEHLAELAQLVLDLIEDLRDDSRDI